MLQEPMQHAAKADAARCKRQRSTLRFLMLLPY
jgi:hypothetical protein